MIMILTNDQSQMSVSSKMVKRWMSMVAPSVGEEGAEDTTPTWTEEVTLMTTTILAIQATDVKCYFLGGRMICDGWIPARGTECLERTALKSVFRLL